jgi:hypothetical protein
MFWLKAGHCHHYEDGREECSELRAGYFVMVEDISFYDCSGVFSDLILARVEGCIADVRGDGIHV